MNREQYEKDRKTLDAPHTKTLKGAREFYDAAARTKFQRQQKFNKHKVSFIKPHGNMLELGCHSGYNLVYYAGQGFNILGIEISQVLINIAQVRIDVLRQEVRDRIRIKRIEIENFKTKEKFDSILLLDILEHVIDPLVVMEKAKSFLAPGGKIYMSHPAIRVGSTAHIRGINKQATEELIKQINLSCLKLWMVGEGSRSSRIYAIAG